jgi:succinyl-CoA synthetase beta subunit
MIRTDQSGAQRFLDDKVLGRDEGKKALGDLLGGKIGRSGAGWLSLPCAYDDAISSALKNAAGRISGDSEVLVVIGIGGSYLGARAALDLGGGATADRIAQAFRILLSDPNARALFVNIFGGITRCDEVAGGIRDAMAARPDETRPIIVRFEGTNKQAGIDILREVPGVRYVEGLSGGVEALFERREAL